MKAKKKFDPKVVQQFFIDHTEKLVIGLVALLFVYLTYQSFMLDEYKKSTKDLETAIAAANRKISEGPSAPSYPTFPDYGGKIDQFKTPVNPADYPMPYPPTWSEFRPLSLRDVPKLLAVERLRAVSGRGAIPKDNTGTTGRRWVVVTGLVPLKKQLEEYRAKFQDAAAFDPAQDVPKYVEFLVQRAEVTPGQAPVWSKPFVAFKDGASAAAQWGNKTAAEVTDAQYIRSTLASPLPLLADVTWGNEAVSPPQIPLVEHPAGKVEAPQGGADGFGAPGHQVAAPAGPSDTGTAAPLPMGPGPGDNPAKPAANVNANIDTEYLLLRYFDFDIKPGKQYQYRVFVVLVNPNYKLPASVILEADSASSQFLGVHGSEPDPNSWSAACISDRVSGDMRLLGGPVTIAAARVPEITADVRILQWQEQNGRNSYYTADKCLRGTILNFKDAVIHTPGTTKTKTDDLLTNSILVDIMGGEPLSRSVKSPGLSLIMDESGILVLHDATVEDEEWQKAIKEPERPQENAPQPAVAPPAGANPAPTPNTPEIGPVRRGGTAH